MSGYLDLITQETGLHGPRARVIEELMRVEHPALDGLGQGEFADAARVAAAAAAHMEDAGTLDAWCSSTGVEAARGFSATGMLDELLRAADRVSPAHFRAVRTAGIEAGVTWQCPPPCGFFHGPRTVRCGDCGNVRAQAAP